MSNRRRWLVAYDIRDSKRLRRVHQVVHAYGEQLQYSVYLCDLDKSERFTLMEELRETMHQKEDSIAFVDLGELERDGSSAIEFMGTPIRLPGNGPRIV